VGVAVPLSVASSLLIVASFPPFDLGFLAWFALSPLFCALRTLRERGPLARGGVGFLFGFLNVLTVYYYGTRMAEVQHVKCLLIVFIAALPYLAFGVLYRTACRERGAWDVLLVPALWVALEYARSNAFFLAWPWTLLGHSQHRCLPVIQVADLTGVYGISFLLVSANQALSRLPDLLRGRRDRVLSGGRGGPGYAAAIRFLAVAVAVVPVFSYGWHRLGAPEGGRRLRVALVQPNILTRNEMSLAEQGEHLRKYAALTREAAREKPDLVVWPASSLPAPITFLNVRIAIRQVAVESGAYLLVGGAGLEKDRPTQERNTVHANSEFLLSPTGRFEASYHKILLLPFNEYLPLEGTIRWPSWVTGLKWSFVPGKQFTLFQVRGTRFGAPICWENFFPDFFRRFVAAGADFMVTVTNESSFGEGSPAPYRQTLAMNVFRAVENRVAIARAAPTGISAFISPAGEVVGEVRDARGNALFVPGVLVRDIPLSGEKTFYTLHGDVFAYGAIAAAVLAVLATWIFDHSASKTKG